MAIEVPTLTLPYKWAPRPHQERLWEYLANGGDRALAIWHRRAGKDDVSLNHACCAAHERIGSYVHMLPEYAQARKAMWDQIDPHTGKRRIDTAFPHELRKATNENEMMIEFKCGSTWQLAGSDNYNAMMGTSYAGMVFSEYALGNPSAWGYFSPILAENGGWAILITTPRGHNHAEAMLKVAQANPNWFWECLRADETGVFTPEQLQEELRTLQGIHGEQFGRAMWMQEYFVSFDAAIPGSIFGEEIDPARANGRIGVVPHDPTLPVHTGWDLGRTDDTAIWWFQLQGDQPRFIDFHKSSLKDVPFYAELLEAKRVDRGFKYGQHWLPHDARPRTLAAPRSIYMQFMDWDKEHGQTLGEFCMAPKLDKQEQIQSGRATLKAGVIDAERCAEGLEDLRTYHRVWDEETHQFSTAPFHGPESHAADGYMTASVAWREKRVKNTIDRDGFPVVKATTFGEMRKQHFAKARAARQSW